MRITLAAVGRAKAGPHRDLYEHYAERFGRGPFGPLILKEVEEHRPLPAARLKEREAELLRAAVPRRARLIALDERGKALSSMDLARLLGHWRDEGKRDLAFVIGGAEGLSKALRESADNVVSLGPLTWPHMLVRALLVEQLYRAQSILAGHPYHRE